MPQHRPIWITIYSAEPKEQSKIIERLKSHFENCPHVICIDKEEDYNRDDDVEFLAHVLYVLNMFLHIKTFYAWPIIISDISMEYILKRMENFGCRALARNIDELYSARRISVGLRCNEFVFFAGLDSKWEFKKMEIPTTNSYTATHTTVCIDEAKRFIQGILDGVLKPDNYQDLFT